jgi:hypothetical protein
MLRLPRAEQIAILEAIQKFPEEKHLAGWLSAWIRAQVAVGPSRGIDISEIPIPMGAGEFARKTAKEIDELFINIGYKDLPVEQRRAAQKFKAGYVEQVEQTNRMADRAECWIGDHELTDEQYDDYLWVINGYWDKDRTFRKWGCGKCADIIHRTHPESEKHVLQ